MSETPSTAEPTAAPAKKRAGLNSMLLADLKAMAGGLGIKGAGSMKKAQLVEAIRGHQAGAGAAAKPAESGAAETKRAEQKQPAAKQPEAKQAAQKQNESKQAEPKQTEARGADAADEGGAPRRRERNRGNRQEQEAGQGEQGQQAGQQRQQGKQQNQNQQNQNQQNQNQQNQGQQQKQRQGQQEKGDQGAQNQQNQGQQQNQQGQQQNQQGQAQHDQDGDESGGRNRRRRGRERGERGGRQRGEPDTTILEDDVLVPAAGILDVLDNYAFVRTSGYAAGPEDVYLSLSMVRKHGLRRGDAVVGQVRQPREGERREKFNPMVRVDLVNGADPEGAEERPEFAELTPVHPSQRLRMETAPGDVVGRVVDLLAPVGKGQRGLIVAPPGSGRTTVLQHMAAAVTANNPECHLMVVLLDERPEEVTDFQRSVKGEVIASTFDRPATDHTTVAELAVERAKRLVEQGHDVVMLIDGLTRLGRAYNLAAPANGRTLPSGVDVSSLHPPKKLFGSARKLEDAGSLTIIATVLVETGSDIDQAIFEEFQGTANSELRLRAEYVDKRLFPAVDVVHSATRRDELLLAEEEATAQQALRRTLGGDPEEALVGLLELVRSSQTNIELLTRVARNARA
ncbi:transcription termination factor Rho [Nocardioides daejeonensis]|uniref:transcription termination factor Rho n=1 Tax=Nocardioides daejeonensis TaxID=1046556 RepID=UPI001EF3E53E|nr:transcription termination factor Rho [Nocardioides daejeonensis]